MLNVADGVITRQRYFDDAQRGYVTVLHSKSQGSNVLDIE